MLTTLAANSFAMASNDDNQSIVSINKENRTGLEQKDAKSMLSGRFEVPWSPQLYFVSDLMLSIYSYLSFYHNLPS